MRNIAAACVLLLTCVLACLVATTRPVQGVEGESRRPNIVIIVADDLGWNDVGYHGSQIRTPNLDKLAAAGVRLEHHYVFPTCSPSRAALLTARNPWRFGILGPIDLESTLAMPLGTVTLASGLKTQGYATANVGKWHLGLRPAVGPRQYGFDHSYGYFHGQIDPYTHLYKTGARTWHRDDTLVEEAGHATDLLAAEAVRWVEAPRTQPFFLALNFSVPHAPLNEEPKWVEEYEGRIAEPSRRLYAASVTHMDDAIGQVVAALNRQGLREKTLILFTSDNGGQRDYSSQTDYGGKYGPYPALGNNEPLRGWKGDLYEGGIRVPALAVWPGTLEPRIVNEPESVLDWLPTLAALTGYKPDPKLAWEGVDIWPLLSGGEGKRASRTFDWETPNATAIREEDWKLIVPRRADALPQLFNLNLDPLEKTDLAASESERVGRLRALLLQRHEQR